MGVAQQKFDRRGGGLTWDGGILDDDANHTHTDTNKDTRRHIHTHTRTDARSYAHNRAAITHTDTATGRGAEAWGEYEGRVASTLESILQPGLLL